MPLVALDRISLAFGALPLFEESSLQIERGERVSVVGRNGVGKSSLLRIVGGEQPPDSGSIEKDPACASPVSSRTFRFRPPGRSSTSWPTGSATCAIWLRSITGRPSMSPARRRRHSSRNSDVSSTIYLTFLGKREEWLASEAVSQEKFDKRLADEDVWLRPGRQSPADAQRRPGPGADGDAPGTGSPARAIRVGPPAD